MPLIYFIIYIYKNKFLDPKKISTHLTPNILVLPITKLHKVSEAIGNQLKKPLAFPISWQKAHIPLKVEKLNSHRFSIVAESNVTRGLWGHSFACNELSYAKFTTNMEYRKLNFNTRVRRVR